MVVEKTTLDTIFTALKGIIVYLDTTILYRLLNLRGSNRYESIRQLMRTVRKPPLVLKVFQCTVEEMKRRIVMMLVLSLSTQHSCILSYRL